VSWRALFIAATQQNYSRATHPRGQCTKLRS